MSFAAARGCDHKRVTLPLALQEGCLHHAQGLEEANVECEGRQHAVHAGGVENSWFGVWGLVFGVWGLGFGVWGLGFRVWVLGLQVCAVDCRGEIMPSPKGYSAVHVFERMRLVPFKVVETNALGSNQAHAQAIGSGKNRADAAAHCGGAAWGSRGEPG